MPLLRTELRGEVGTDHVEIEIWNEPPTERPKRRFRHLVDGETVESLQQQGKSLVVMYFLPGVGDVWGVEV